MPALHDVLRTTDDWPVGAAAVSVIGADGAVRASHGDPDRPFALASVTKLLTAYAVLLAVEEGAVELDEPAGPPGSTVRHLLAHASGLAAEAEVVMAAPGARRIYSNSGYEAVARQVESAVQMPFVDYLRDGVLTPLRMTSTTLTGSPAHGAASTVTDLVKFLGELLRPTLLDPMSVAEATRVQFPGLTGVVPGFGRQDPNDWGLGPELHAHKTPHWMAPDSGPSAFGHFGRAGTFVWVEPTAGLACVCLTDTAFGPWAVQAWPAFSSAVRAACT